MHKQHVRWRVAERSLPVQEQVIVAFWRFPSNAFDESEVVNENENVSKFLVEKKQSENRYVRHTPSLFPTSPNPSPFVKVALSPFREIQTMPKVNISWQCWTTDSATRSRYSPPSPSPSPATCDPASRGRKTNTIRPKNRILNFFSIILIVHFRFDVFSAMRRHSARGTIDSVFVFSIIAHKGNQRTWTKLQCNGLI